MARPIPISPDLAEAESEIERELEEAINRMRSQEPSAGAVEDQPEPVETQADTAEAPEQGSSAAAMRIFGGILDKLLVFVVLVLTLLNLPFRRMPLFVRRLLGYAAVGTAVMAAALWLYILLGGVE